MEQTNSITLRMIFKKTKKLTIVLLTISLILLFACCSKNSQNPNVPSSDRQTETDDDLQNGKNDKNSTDDGDSTEIDGKEGEDIWVIVD